MKRLLERIKNNPFWSSVISIGSGKLISQFIAIITVPLCSRIYAQEAYGEYGILISTVSIVTSFAALGLTSAIMAPEEEEKSKRVFMAAFWAQSSVSTLFFIALVALAPVYRFFTVSGSYYFAAGLMYVYMLLNTLKNTMAVYINRKGLNRVLFVNPIIGSACTLILTIPLGLIGAGYRGFLTAAIAGEAISCVQMLLRANPFLKGFRWNDWIAVVKEYKDYILFQMPSNALEGVATQYPTQYLSRTFGNTALGAYSLCTQLLNYPINLIAAPISSVYFRTASEYQRNGKNLGQFTYRLVMRIMLVALLPAAVVLFWGPELFAFVLGEKWYEAGMLAGILIWQYVMRFCAQTTSYCRVALGRQKLNMIYTIINLISSVLSCMLGFLWFGTLTGTLIVFSIGRIVVYIFDMWLNFMCMKEYAGKYLCLAILLSLIMIGTVLIKFCG